MAVFKFKAKSKEGKVTQGTVVAGDEKEAANQLRSGGLSPLSVKEEKPKKKLSLFGSKHLPTIEKANFCRYMAAMIKSGLPLTEAVDVLCAESSHPTLQKILNDVRASLQKGQFLSGAFAKHPEVFDEIFLTLIKAGEDSGTLDKSFEYLGKQLYADYELKQKIKSTLAYPAVVTLATLGLGVAMLVFVVPKIAPVLLRLGETFPLPSHTVVILKTGMFVSKYIFVFLGIGAGLFFALIFFLGTRQGKRILLNVLSRVPVIKDFYIHLVLARFSRTLSTLLRTGVPIVEALEVSGETLNLPRFRKFKTQVTGEVGKGQPLSDVMKKSRLFPPIMTSMVTTGEKTSSMDKLLLNLAKFYEEKVSDSLKMMTDMIEPVLMLGIGLAVGAAVVSLIAPIYSFVGSLSASIGG